MNPRITSKALAIAAASILLASCDDIRTTWIERQIPTTDKERQAVAQHVEAIIPSMLPESLGGDDQDLEDIINEAHNEARKSFCRPTIWELNGNHYTGRWKYSEQITEKP